MRAIEVKDLWGCSVIRELLVRVKIERFSMRRTNASQRSQSKEISRQPTNTLHEHDHGRSYAVLSS
jgi:hypothetical protein